MRGHRVIPQQVIANKRDGGALTPGQMRGLLNAYLDGTVGDDQMAAFLMAVYFNGLGVEELDVMVDVMLRSGDVLDRGMTEGPRVDKHSTGGVGDKVSIVLAPLAAELGMIVPMMSGRSLGHTGGTLDKLESIPGLRTRIPVDRFNRVLASVGCAMIGQTDEIAPLDRRLYALRDVTATVPSLPLITASIMSKKLAEGLDGLVLDVKVGRGAFLTRIAESRELARAMVDVGARRGLAVTAVLSAMDRPLGRTVGNALEVREAVECLSGGGPGDLRELSVELVAEMGLSGKVFNSPDEGRRRAEQALDGGGALERFLRMVAAQGGSLDLSRTGFGLPRAPLTRAVAARRDGIVSGINPRALGYGVIPMGGGRTRQDQDVDPRVGFELQVRTGDAVSAGDVLAVIHGAEDDDLVIGTRVVADAVTVAEAVESDPLPLVIERAAAD
ncbi:MAG: thymidine phosphorylase [Gemmatimonadetes bacterium]|nr:thymidine phosphorylase [Gemmatimonadota bacterium]